MPNDEPQLNSPQPGSPQSNFSPAHSSQPGRSPLGSTAPAVRLVRKVPQSLSLTQQFWLLGGAIALITLVAAQFELADTNTLATAVLLVLPVGILLWLRLFIVRPVRLINGFTAITKGQPPQNLAIAPQRNLQP
ncbi:hypothetical protein HC928_19795 [bacterium]|nr:hypothetical protein [bacterium]